MDAGRKVQAELRLACCRMQDGACILVASPSDSDIEVMLSQDWEPWLLSMVKGGGLQGCPPADIESMRLVGERVFQSLPERVEDVACFDALASQGRDIPWVLASSAGKGCVEVVSFVPPSLRAFRGHFPSQPVVPGALLLNWVGEWIKTQLGDQRPLLEMTQVKFSKIVQPCDVIKFSGRSSAGGIKYCVSSRKGVHASGTFRFRETS